MILCGGEDLSKIRNVQPKENYLLEITMEDERVLKLDFSKKLGTIRFGLLEDKDFFKEAITDGCYVRWRNLIAIS